MLRNPFCLLLSQVFQFVIILSVCRHITYQYCCFIFIGRKRIFVFGTKRMLLIQHVVEACLNAIVATDNICLHANFLLPKCIGLNVSS